jgi:uncharacterized protein (TIGR02271 family)
MAEKKREGTVVGLFHERADAEEAIRGLKDAGFSDSQIGVLMQDREGQKELADATGAKVADAATTGAIGGGVAGGIVGLLAGVGALAIPGVGPIIAGGALASTLAGAGIGAAAGGILGALVGMGIPEEDARYFESGLKSGGILVTVDAGSRREEARGILSQCGADLDARTGRFTSSGVTGSAGLSDREDRDRLQLREEELHAEKKPVQAGEVRVRKDVIEEKKTIDVPVTREEVVVERHPVSGRERSDGDIGEDEEIRIPVMEEQVRVEKTPVVKEEVSIKKRAVQETKQVSDTVRREEAHVDQSGGARVRTEGTSGRESWRGKERRYHRDKNYSGPERRTAGV